LEVELSVLTLQAIAGEPPAAVAAGIVAFQADLAHRILEGVVRARAYRLAQVEKLALVVRDDRTVLPCATDIAIAVAIQTEAHEIAVFRTERPNLRAVGHDVRAAQPPGELLFPVRIVDGPALHGRCADRDILAKDDKKVAVGVAGEAVTSEVDIDGQSLGL